MSLPAPRARSTGGSGVGRQRNQPRRHLLIWLSGADTDTLARTPRERRKFVGLGGIVLTTSTLAAVSCTFAMTAGARAPLAAAIVVGLFWGLAIMNLDRWLVTATQRRPGWWRNVLAALPRIVMALIIGAVISTPLVLWLFQREIESELNVLHQQRLDRHEQNLRDDTRFREIPELEKAVARNRAIADGTASGAAPDETVKQLQTEFENLDKQFQDAQNQATCEFDGTCGTKTRGNGEAYRQKMQVAQELRQRRDEVKQRLDAAKAAAAVKQQETSVNERASAAEQAKRDQERLDRLRGIKKAEEDRFKADISNDRGLLARLEALSTLTGRNTTLSTAYLLLMLFITTIEVLPVLVKLLINLGPPTAYDEILARAEKTDIDTADAQLDVERNLTVYELQERARREEEALRSRVDRMIAAEEEIHDRELRQWRNSQLDGPPAQRTGGFVGRLRRRRRGTGPTYTQWPAAENSHRSSGPRTGNASIDYGEPSDRWSYDK